MDNYKDCHVRWRRRATGPPEDLHQRRQAADLLVYLLWHSLRELPSIRKSQSLGLCSDVYFQAKEQHRKLLQSLPSTTYPLEPIGHPAEVNEAQRVSDVSRVFCLVVPEPKFRHHPVHSHPEEQD